MALPQSLQNLAPSSFCDPQRVQYLAISHLLFAQSTFIEIAYSSDDRVYS